MENPIKMADLWVSLFSEISTSKQKLKQSKKESSQGFEGIQLIYFDSKDICPIIRLYLLKGFLFHLISFETRQKTTQVVAPQLSIGTVTFNVCCNNFSQIL